MFGVFTRTTAGIAYDLGNDKLASQLYYKSYKKSGDIECIYRALNIEIKYMNNNTTAEYYEYFESDDEYEEFMKALKVRNENANVGVLEKSSLLFEDNYLENNYIIALAGIGDTQKEKALNRAVERFKDSVNSAIMLDDLGVYALGAFILEDDVFDKTYDGFTKPLIEEMQLYFDKLYNVITNVKCEELPDIEKAYAIAMCNRIITIGQDINSRYEGISEKDELKNGNIAKMTAVNDIIKGLL